MQLMKFLKFWRNKKSNIAVAWRRCWFCGRKFMQYDMYRWVRHGEWQWVCEPCYENNQ